MVDVVSIYENTLYLLFFGLDVKTFFENLKIDQRINKI